MRNEGMIEGRAYFVTDPEPTTFRNFVAMLASLQGLSIEKLGSSLARWCE